MPDETHVSPSTNVIQEVQARLSVADRAWRAPTPERLGEGLRACDEALAHIQAAGGPPQTEGGPATLSLELAGLLAAVWLQRGHLFEALSANGQVEAIQEALRGYEQAIVLYQQLPESASPAHAAAWMNRGNVLQKIGAPEALAEAVNCYDRTISLLGSPAPDASPEHINMLGAAWMNRGCTQQRLVSETTLADALVSLDNAISLLAPLSASHTHARRNLALSWTNRGFVLLQLKDAAGAIQSQENALALLEPLLAADPSHLVIERAGMQLNLGQAHWARGAAEPALAALNATLSAVAPFAATDPAATDLGLRARHAACIVLGARLAFESAGSAERASSVAEAGDLVEDGLALVSTWGERAAWFDEPARRLFEFGTWLYRSQQPRFLAEFLLDNLRTGDIARAEIAWTAVTRARQEVVQRGFASLTGPEATAVADELAGLRSVEQRLRELSTPPVALPTATNFIAKTS